MSTNLFALSALPGRWVVALCLAAAIPAVGQESTPAEEGYSLEEVVVRRGARGIVVAGFGSGTCSQLAIEALQRAVSRGLIVVRASRIDAGFVNRNTEIDDDKLGFVASLDLSPQKARILTQLLIANGVSEPTAVQQAFEDVEQ